MRATKHAPGGPFRILKDRNGLAELVERRAGVPEERLRVIPPRVVGARLDRDRDGLVIFFVGVILFRAAAALYPSTKRLVSARLPVSSLAGLIAISGLRISRRCSSETTAPRSTISARP